MGLDEGNPEEQLTDVIELVSHETRARALVELGAAQASSPRDPVLSFSELRRRVGHDDPGNFNYHLDRLRGRLIERHDEGYRLSDVGHNFLGVLLSGRFDPTTSVELPKAKAACMICGNPVTVSYDDAVLHVDCNAGHEARLLADPRTVADHDLEGALNAALRRSLAEARLAAAGDCPFCGGRVTGGLERAPDSNESAPAAFHVAVCNRCGATLQNTLGGHLLSHPAVVAACWRAGVNALANPWTALVEYVGQARVLEEEPLRVAVDVTVDRETTTLTVDGEGVVVAVDGDVTGSSDLPIHVEDDKSYLSD